MTILEWTGEIGWELWLPTLRAQLKKTNGDDITVRFSSIGGSIFEGSDIFNMLADHRRDNPDIKMNLEIKAIAASMGSAIAASPAWDNITIEPTSWFMVHNPRGFVIGDYRDMQDSSDFFKKAHDMWAAVYASKATIPLGAAQKMMDDETWLMGEEIVTAGFADSVNDVPGEGKSDGSMSKKEMKMRFSEMEKRQRDANDIPFDKQRAVACFRTPAPGMLDNINENKEDAAESGSNKPPGETTMEVPVDKKELKEKNPAIYDESVNDGVMIERARVKILTDMKAEEEYKDIPKVAEAIDKAIEEGKTPAEAQTLVMAVLAKIIRDPQKTDADESPGDIEGADVQPVMQTTEKIREV